MAPTPFCACIEYQFEEECFLYCERTTWRELTVMHPPSAGLPLGTLPKTMRHDAVFFLQRLLHDTERYVPAALDRPGGEWGRFVQAYLRFWVLGKRFRRRIAQIAARRLAAVCIQRRWLTASYDPFTGVGGRVLRKRAAQAVEWVEAAKRSRLA